MKDNNDTRDVYMEMGLVYKHDSPVMMPFPGPPPELQIESHLFALETWQSKELPRELRRSIASLLNLFLLNYDYQDRPPRPVATQLRCCQIPGNLRQPHPTNIQRW